ncbi:hypothetical protein G2W53_017038 [Senna tora]|uniref:Uncharacterized protein n=1 Tax=Senna tora TaxID=362788 RepID=A0A834WQN5_9FABA|nr:hypothetical protein G2W53_017038 [Senna tora]
MAAELENSDRHDSHQFKTTALRTNKTKSPHSRRGQDLLKAVLRKRTNKVSRMEGTASTESKKICISTPNQQSLKGETLFKVPMKNTSEKVTINGSESIGKPKKEPRKMCFCSPTTHEGSFRCHLHRISAARKPASDKKSNLGSNSKRTPGTVEFKPQLSRFGRAASAEVMPHDGLKEQSEVSSA